jgi:hypothetical protein
MTNYLTNGYRIEELHAEEGANLKISNGYTIYNVFLVTDDDIMNYKITRKDLGTAKPFDFTGQFPTPDSACDAVHRDIWLEWEIEYLLA